MIKLKCTLYCVLFLPFFVIGSPSYGEKTAVTAKKEVALLLFVEDQGEAFTRDQFDQFMAAKREILSVPLIGVFVSRRDTWESLVAQLKLNLQENEQVGELILATHGNTLRSLNTTILDRLGSFGLFGTRGALSNLIYQLKGKWAPDVFVYLEACSTFRGTEWMVKSRAKSLFRTFASVGVKNLSIWGAHQRMMDANSIRHLVLEQSEFKDQGVAFSLGAMLGATAALYTYHATSSGTLATFAGMFGFLSGIKAAIKLFTGPVDTHGTLVTVNSTGVQAVEMDADDPRVQSLKPCEALLSTQAD